VNQRLRVLLIGRHFWPFGSIDSAGFLFQIACDLHRRGVHVEVVSPHYASSWPAELTVGEILGHRPVAAPKSDWSMGRYIRNLTTWLRQHAGSFDVMMVDAIREESTAAIEAARIHGCPTILRCGRWGDDSDPQWWQTGRSARRCGSIGKMANAVVAPTAACQRLLLADGYAASRVQRITDGIAAGPLQSAESRQAARTALATVNSDLVTNDDTPVVICASRMTSDGGVNLLTKAARHLVARYPDLRLWFIGDGPHRDRMYEFLRGEGVRASIAMPGSFCDIEELFVAADIFLQPDDDGLDYFLPTAIASELPVVTIDSESTRAVITARTQEANPTDEQNPASMVQWCSAATAKQIRIGIVGVLDDLPGFRTKASQLRRLLVRTRPQSDTVQAYVKLMEGLARNNSGNRRRSSAEAVS
jgi:glycosyltransferase involved in cell wall biosynthesis